MAFEAAVAGGVPIIKALREGLTANRIEWIAGIINGTTNFILSEMRAKGLDFDVVLKEAQRLGYAEADPTFDIEGVDAAHKVTLMSAIAFGMPMQFDKAYVEGITRLQAADIAYAEQLGFRIKLLGITRRRAGHRAARASDAGAGSAADRQRRGRDERGDGPGRRRRHHALLRQGAGAEPTASAVVADLIDIARLRSAEPGHRVPHLAFQHDAMAATPVLPIEQVVTAYYLRLQVADQAGVLARITGILAERDISIDALLQRPHRDAATQGGAKTDVIILTHDTVEGRMRDAIAEMQALADGAGADREDQEGGAGVSSRATRGRAPRRPVRSPRLFLVLGPVSPAQPP